MFFIRFDSLQPVVHDACRLTCVVGPKTQDGHCYREMWDEKTRRAGNIVMQNMRDGSTLTMCKDEEFDKLESMSVNDAISSTDKSSRACSHRRWSSRPFTPTA